MILVRSGAKVPADIIIFHSVDCKVDMSTLTGETEPVSKAPLENGAGSDVEAIDAVSLSSTHISWAM